MSDELEKQKNQSFDWFQFKILLRHSVGQTLFCDMEYDNVAKIAVISFKKLIHKSLRREK